MKNPDNLKYAETHEWVLVENDIATVGITDHAQCELGDLVVVDLPQIGRKVQQKEAIAVVESTKAASDIYAPVSGEIIAVNESLNSSPGLVNTSPFQDGWLFKVKMSDPAQPNSLLDAQAYSSKI